MTENIIRILLVEDDDIDSEAMERYIHKASLPYDLKIATTENEAIEALNSFDFDVVLLDYNLQTSTGLDILPKVGSVPAIFLTGNGSEEVAIKAMRLGAYDYLVKDPDRNYLKVFSLTINNVLKRYQAEINFKKSEERFRALTENATDLTIIFDKKGIIKYINPAVKNTFGYSIEEAIGKNMFDIMHPDNMKLVKIAIDKAVGHAGQALNLESFCALHKNGSRIYLSGNIIYMPDISSINGIVGNFKDITIRYQTELALKESEEKFHTIADFGYDWEYWISPQHEFIYISPSCERITGYSPNEFMQNPKLFTSIVHLDDVVNLKKHKHIVLNNKEIDQIEFRIITKSGEERWIGHVCQTVYNDNGVNLGIRGSNRDITEKKLAESNLKESEEKWKYAIEGNADGLWDWNLITNDVYFSEQWKKMLGFLANEISGSLEEWDKRIHPDDKKKVYEDIKKHLNGETDYYKNEHRVLRKDNSYIWVLDRGKILSYTSDNKPERMIGTHSDISNRKESEQALIESEESLKLMIENSNDGISIIKDERFVFINTPFSKILDYTVEELQSLSLKEILSEESYNYLIKGISHFIDSDSDHIRSEVVMVKKDKSLIDAKIMIKNIKYKGEFVQVSQIRDITEQKKMIKFLQRGAEQTKGLKEFIPICAGCSSIREDEKENTPWLKPADYITQYLPDVKFSHSMCPDCMKKWYPEIYAKKS